MKPWISERWRATARRSGTWSRRPSPTRARRWLQWRANLKKASRPDAAVRIAELILKETADATETARPLKLFETSVPAPVTASAGAKRPPGAAVRLPHPHQLLRRADTLPELHRFLRSPGIRLRVYHGSYSGSRRLIGKYGELLNFTLAPGQVDEYLDMLERERRRAWRKYDMLVMTGLEFNKEGFTKKTSGHLLGIHSKPPSPLRSILSRPSPRSTARAHWRWRRIPM